MLDTTFRAGRAPRLALATAASVVALTATAPQAEAAFIDNFAQTLFVSGNDLSAGDTLTDNDRISATSIDRKLSFTLLEGDGGFGNGALISGGLFQLATGPGDQGEAVLEYSFGRVDLSSLDLVVPIKSVELNDDALKLDFFVSLTDEDGKTGTLSETISEPDDGKQLIFALAGFGIDSSTVTEAKFELKPTGKGDDLVLGPIAAVPLPGALPLFLGGLAGAGYVWRRQRRAAEAA